MQSAGRVNLHDRVNRQPPAEGAQPNDEIRLLDFIASSCEDPEQHRRDISLNQSRDPQMRYLLPEIDPNDQTRSAELNQADESQQAGNPPVPFRWIDHCSLRQFASSNR